MAKESIERIVTNDDVIMAIICGSRKKSIPSSPEFLHGTFFELKESYPKLLKGFVFDESSIVPLSDELDAVFFRLGTAGILQSLSPSYEEYHVDDMRFLRDSYQKFKGDAKEDINRCAEEFSKLMNKYVESS